MTGAEIGIAIMVALWIVGTLSDQNDYRYCNWYVNCLELCSNTTRICRSHMDRNHFISVVIFTIVLALVPHWINAKTVAGVGEYDFGADITENDSCDKALTKAEADAIERAFGVTVGATDWEMCDNETCDFRQMSWIETHGHVVEIKNINKVILENPRRCRVSIVADVEQTPTIDLSLIHI